ncbi:MAG: 1-phosphofructokinase [Bacillota bacterium]
MPIRNSETRHIAADTPQIATVTLNPAIDRTILVEGFRPAGLNRAAGVRLDAGGKGINVSKVSAVLGYPSVALGFLGGETGRHLERLISGYGIRCEFTWTAGETRTNLKIIDVSRKKETEINESGLFVDPDHVTELKDKVLGWSRRVRVMVFSGSLPPGMDSSIYADLIWMAKEGGAAVILDAEGDALRLGMEARPHLVKPNLAEVEAIFSRKPQGLRDAAGMAAQIVARGIETAVISLGRRGCAFASGDVLGWANAPTVEVLSTVGAGDAMVAGLAVSMVEGKTLDEAIRLAVAASAASVAEPGTGLPSPENIQRLSESVQVRRVRRPVNKCATNDLTSGEKV